MVGGIRKTIVNVNFYCPNLFSGGASKILCVKGEPYYSIKAFRANYVVVLQSIFLSAIAE